MLLFFRQMFLTRVRARACVYVCVVHWHCTAQLNMFNMEKRFRNKIIIIIIIIILVVTMMLLLMTIKTMVMTITVIITSILDVAFSIAIIKMIISTKHLRIAV